jgi:hypothetical protein
MLPVRLTERFNQTLVSHLMRLVNGEKNDWDEHLDTVLFGYRVTQQTSAKFSPFHLMYGVRPRLPYDLERSGDATHDENAPEDLQERAENILEGIKATRDEAMDNIQKAQANQKERYDLKHQGPTYRVGDKVLKYDRRKDTRMGGKLDERYLGPYVVHEVTARGCYRLADGDKIMKQMVNAINLKPFHEPTSPSNTPRKGSNPTTPQATPTKGHPANPRADTPRKRTPGSPRTTPSTPQSHTPRKGTPRSPVTTPLSPSAPKRKPATPSNKTPTTPQAQSTTTKPKTPFYRKTPGFMGDATEQPATGPAPVSPTVADWLPALNLNADDRHVLLSGQWLNDKLMDACNDLVARHIGLDSNQSTLLVQGAGGFRPISGDVIQALHDTNHWVACASLGGRLYFADSAHRPISGSVAGQLRQLFPAKVKLNGGIEVTVLPSDTQPNGSDCGLYAAAFMFQWACGIKSCEMGFNNTQMRGHLADCLEMDQVQPFPIVPVRRRGRKRREHVMSVM